jgi:hypothetical protein
MRPKQTSYRGFLLRVWSPGDRAQARTSVTDIQTGETRVFVDVDGLCSWLRGLGPRDVSRVDQRRVP